VKGLDRLLQRWRIGKAAKHLPPNARILDVGCFDGTLFRQLGTRSVGGVGIDPALADGLATVGGARLVRGHFPEDLPPDEETFDAITMLAVVEHIPADVQHTWALACETRLRPGGRLVITTPSPFVDRILDVLRAMRIIDGMSLDEHYGFDPRLVPERFTVPGLHMVRTERFQLGLNHLFVFERVPA
jgi:2-polyprenyl-3-methyl-5-hydroxy-6-metoxy-1,4-benzoquinol methylase